MSDHDHDCEQVARPHGCIVRLCLNINSEAKASFHALVSADVLVLASGLRLLALLLLNGIKYCLVVMYMQIALMGGGTNL